MDRRQYNAICGRIFLILAVALCFSNCASTNVRTAMVVSAADQKMVLLKDGDPVKEYEISTSKFGLGDQRGSYRTPVGKMKVAQKIGDKLPSGAVLKSRRPTGEVLRPNSPGRDPIVTRIIWLKGTETKNRNAYSRCIYIHGTPEERTIGKPASYGCIRMRSRDVIDLFRRVGVGSNVYVTTRSFEGPSARARGGSRHGSAKRGEPSGDEIMKKALASTSSPPPVEVSPRTVAAAKAHERNVNSPLFFFGKRGEKKIKGETAEAVKSQKIEPWTRTIERLEDSGLKGTADSLSG